MSGTSTGPNRRPTAGPEAVGHGVVDGLFLFVLEPGPIDGQALITVKTANGGSLVVMHGQAFTSIESTGVKQPSGCYTLG